MGDSFESEEALDLILGDFDVFCLVVLNFGDDLDGYSLALIKWKLRVF